MTPQAPKSRKKLGVRKAFIKNFVMHEGKCMPSHTTGSVTPPSQDEKSKKSSNFFKAHQKT